MHSARSVTIKGLDKAVKLALPPEQPILQININMIYFA